MIKGELLIVAKYAVMAIAQQLPNQLQKTCLRCGLSIGQVMGHDRHLPKSLNQ
nr:hypothetical protein [Pseudanabaena mucicola]